MSDDNPFEVSSDAYGDRSGYDRGSAGVEVSLRTIELLNQTRPWVSLMGGLLWISTVLIGIGSLMALAGAAMSGQATLIVIAGLYVLTAVVYGYLARSLTGYSSRINRLSASESVQDLEDAIESQKNFWRAIGIITVVVLLLYVVFLILMFAGVAFIGNLGNNL